MGGTPEPSSFTSTRSTRAHFTTCTRPGTRSNILEEDEAITRLKRRDIAALEALVKRYSVRALRTAFLITRDRPSAEDIVQAAFLRVFQRIDQFQVGRPFEPWFLRIVINDALMLHRAGSPVSLDGLDGIFEGGAPMLPDTQTLPDEILIAKETTEAVWEALGRLSAIQRAAIVMRYYLGMSEEEMAAELGCAPGTVKSRLHAARQGAIAPCLDQVRELKSKSCALPKAVATTCGARRNAETVIQSGGSRR